MTVEELIEELKEFPSDYVVVEDETENEVVYVTKNDDEEIVYLCII